jgi:hypothetical protein
MRNVFLLLVLLGVAGFALGVLGIVQHASGPNGVPFHFENYGGPGPMIAGLVLVAGGLYLWSNWSRLGKR